MKPHFLSRLTSMVRAFPLLVTHDEEFDQIIYSNY
uniref:Uncharacterized protein n=1 Tax=Rhizophora mucronata TaxID=61149 RepID=A0A2P2PYY4_RHIMU